MLDASAAEPSATAKCQVPFALEEERMSRHPSIALLGLIAALTLGGAAVAQEDSPASQGLKIKGFYLGMPQGEVRQLYESMKADAVAPYMSIETSEYRDLIMVDREFGSMGNKIEVQYDESGAASYFKFQYNTVAVLLDYGVTEPGEFVTAFCEQYGIPEMAFEDQGMVKIWSHSDPEAGYKLSIDDYMNVTLQVP